MQNTNIDHNDVSSSDNVFFFQFTDIIRNVRITKAVGLDEISG